MLFIICYIENTNHYNPTSYPHLIHAKKNYFPLIWRQFSAGFFQHKLYKYLLLKDLNRNQNNEKRALLCG